jgi:hypothetical protein
MKNITRKMFNISMPIIALGTLACVLLSTAEPKIKEFTLPDGRKAIAHYSIFSDNKQMTVFDKDTAEQEVLGSIGNYTTLWDIKTGKLYAIGRNGYFTKESTDTENPEEIPFGNDSLSLRLKSEKARYDSLMNLAREEGD